MQYFSQDKNRAGSKQRRGLPTNQRKTKRVPKGERDEGACDSRA